MDTHKKNPSVLADFKSDDYRIFNHELAYIHHRRYLADLLEPNSLHPEEENSQPANNDEDSPSDPPDQMEKDAVQPATELNLVGLALSGGGIRSATFNLGLLQALFQNKVLNHIDYLSTVSGGGYIGSCLTTVLNSKIQNCNDIKDRFVYIWDPENFPFARYKKSKSDEPPIKPDPTQEKVEGEKNQPQPGAEKATIKYLRYFSNYLTAEGNFIQKYFGPLLVLLRGVLFNFLLIAPYLLLLALILSYVFNISSIYSFGKEKNNRWFLDIREFQSALAERKLAAETLEQTVILKTAELKFSNYAERLKYARSVEGINRTIRDRENDLDAKRDAVTEEWRDIWRLPKYLFIFIFIFSLVFLAVFTKSFSRRHLYSKYFSASLFLLLLLVGVQFYGLVLVYWGYWEIPPELGLFSILTFLTPKLLDTGRQKSKNNVTQIFISIFVFLLAPFFLLYVIGVSIKFIIPSLQSYASLNFGVDTSLSYILILLAIVLLWHVVEKTININKITPHNFYRDRLSRAYLFQNDPKSSERPFEKLSPCDNLKLSQLEPLGPYQIINTNLNLSKRLQNGKNDGHFREGESFIFSKYWCGSDKTGFLQTSEYERLDAHQNLGTAMAISGAAVNVGMAQSNQPIYRFLMGLLNIRLGYWAIHPGSYVQKFKSILYGDYPGSWTSIREWFGNYSLNYRFVNLSDGGHFDNSGIYELLRRRCKYIIAGDAEADPEMSFQALSYIIRLARIDFGIDIKINLSDILPNDKTGYSLNHCVVGEIYYPDGSQGYLFYCKSSLTGDEPQHLLEYKNNHPSFPHQTTADQWFDEQQFEAYRSLGFHVAQEAFKPIGEVKRGQALEDNFIKLKQYWYPHSPAVRKNFARHGQELNQIITTIKADEDLAFMDYQIFPEWADLLDGVQSKPAQTFWLPDDPGQIRKGFYICNLMIRFMENVYTDLNLKEEYNHPDNRGWMNLFMHWSWAGMFRVTWSISACTYGARFQSFCQNHLNLDLGEIIINKLADGQNASQLKKNLNPYENMIVKKLRQAQDFTFTDAYSFKLKVSNVLDKRMFKQFNFGFALTQDNTIVFFRIQNHLRAMGLGRMALLQLVGILNGQAAYNFSNVPIDLLSFEEFQANEFANMFQSVLTELGN